LELSADQARSEGQRYFLRGHVRLERPGERLTADRMRYDRVSGRAEAEGRVVYTLPGLRLEAARAELHTRTRRARLEQVRYHLPGRGARGTAVRAEQRDPRHQRLERATYTTCPGPRPSWRIEAHTLTLDRQRQVARARHVKLRVRSVPVLYLPRMSYSLDRSRKTGFLTPGLGHSGNNGTELRLPFYWNIAPERDATLTPRYLEKRGVQLLGEYRYLGHGYRGRLELEALPGDRLRHQDRSLVAYEHGGWFSPRLDGEIHYRRVSDPDYFRDLGGSLGLASQVHLDRNARLTWHAGTWSLTGRVQDFQTLDPTLPPEARPYRRLPQLSFSGRLARRPLGLESRLDAELVRFTQQGRVDGTRLDLRPAWQRTWGGAAWEATPALTLRHTRYWLSGQDPGTPSRPTRTTPIASLDLRLFLERDSGLFGPGGLQTLEPRLFWLYVPYRDQDRLPVFDTGRRDFNDLLLFADNRFSGADRQGDAHQLTLALTSRFLDPRTGTQHAALTLGEIRYFRDRRVTLPGESIDQRPTSDLLAHLDLALARALRLEASLQWDPHAAATRRSGLGLRYRQDPRHRLQAAYRYRNGILEQVDASGLWYLNPTWHLVGRWQYSLRHHTLLEGLAGIEYEQCCWLARLVVRRYVADIDGAHDQAFLVQVVLKGLTRIGHPVEQLLAQSVLGYADRARSE
ncbi:MAG: LPS-assembly protein LptD, partial [Gammaproteobacteria bacterium]